MWPFKRLKYEPNILLRGYVDLNGPYYNIELTGRYYIADKTDEIFVEVRYYDYVLLFPVVTTEFVPDKRLQFYQVCNRGEK